MTRVKDIYSQQFQLQPRLTAIHAGLEVRGLALRLCRACCFHAGLSTMSVLKLLTLLPLLHQRIAQRNRHRDCSPALLTVFDNVSKLDGSQDSSVLLKCSNAEVSVGAVQCGILNDRLGGGLDMVSFGPTIRGAHSPDERVQVATVSQFWDLTLALMRNLATQP